MKIRLALGVALLAVAALALQGAAVAAEPAEATGVAASAGLEVAAPLTGPVMVELEGDPAAVAYAEAQAAGGDAAGAGKEQKLENDQAQAAILPALQQAGTDVLYTVQTAYNGIAVDVDSPAQAAELAALPGVKALHPIPLVELDNASSVGLVGAHQAWQAFGRTGEGMTIGVIDTGVDYVHTGFAGSGSSADLAVALAAANNVENANEHEPFSIPGIYPTTKVVGGHDFVGDAYNAGGSAAAQIPHPDRNPMDCNGHGTHVAGTAAGTGVNADGTTYTGPYNTSVPADTMRVGPGVAPRAEVYALRVFGCAGSTAVTAQAIDWATDPNGDGDTSDHLDVINMSLGSPYGTPDDPSAAASNTAAAAGVIVVTSAGNNMDITYVTSSPGTATRAVSTASSTDAVDVTDAFRVEPPSSIAGLHGASRSVNFNWTSPPASSPLPVTAPLYYPETNQYGCSNWTGADLAAIAGKIVIVDWKKPGDVTFPCGSTQRANSATNAGAKGILMVDNVPYLDTAISGNATTPAMYSTSTVGDALKSAIAGGTVNATLSAEWNSTFRLITPGREDMLSGFSSRGPRARGAALKPDIAAPGQGIFSVGSRSLNMGLNNQGTSMASPHVAGTMALLKSEHPDWSVEELKALVMNTATHDLFVGLGQTGDKYGVSRIGAGRLDVHNALGNDVVAYNNDGTGSVSVSFGAVEVRGHLNQTREIKVVNHSANEVEYDLGIEIRNAMPGVEFEIAGNDDLRLRPGQTKTFRVRLEADAEDMLNARDPSLVGVQGGNPRQWLNDAGGYATLTPEGGGQTLRVPVYAAPRPASKLSAGERLRIKQGVGLITLSGRDVETGTEPDGFVSKVSAFELQLTSPQATLPAGTSELARNADLRYVGAAMNAAKSNVYFGIATWGEWATPATDVQFSVQIDADRNGTVDRTLFNTRFTDTDVFVTAVTVGAATLATGLPTNVFTSALTTAPFDNSVVVLPIPVAGAAGLGLPAGTTRFNYRVLGLSRFWSGPAIETTPWLTYDVANPGLTFAGGLADTPMFQALRRTRIPVIYNAANFAANGSQGALLLHHFNESERRTEVLQVTGS